MTTLLIITILSFITGVDLTKTVIGFVKRLNRNKRDKDRISYK